MTIGERIRELRKERCLTQTELAERVGITVQAVCSHELGKGKPSLRTIRGYAKALGVDIGDIRPQDGR